MGIKKLFTYLNNNNLYKIYPFINDLIQDLDIDKNKLLVGIDGNLYCYKYSHSYDNMLIGFYNQIIKFLSNGIYPFYIFDGGTLLEKEDTNIMRNNKKNISKQKLEKVEEELRNSDNENSNDLLLYKKKLEKNAIKITSSDINKLIDLLDILNIPYLFSHGEGEYLAVLLNQYKIIDLFLTDDTDPIPSGIHHMIKFYSNNVLYLDIKNIYNKLEITKAQLCDFSILLGSDYAVFPHGLKPDELLLLIKKYDTIENVIVNIKLNGNKISQEKKNEILLTVNKIRNIYNNSPLHEKKLIIEPNAIINDYNIITNINNINMFSNTILEYWDNLTELLCIDENDHDNIIKYSDEFKFTIINFIKKRKFSVKNIIKFLKNNISDITDDELHNANISFTYLNTFQN